MKKYFLLFSVLIISLSACNKNDATTQAAVDETKIQAYIKANNITGLIKDPSGVYYKILINGPTPGPTPISTSSVKVSYTGKYLNGQSFDAIVSNTLLVSYFSAGFQTCIEKVYAGSRIMMIIPSTLAYGSAGSVSPVVAPNAILLYTVDLQGFY